MTERSVHRIFTLPRLQYLILEKLTIKSILPDDWTDQSSLLGLQIQDCPYISLDHARQCASKMPKLVLGMHNTTTYHDN